MFQQLALPRRRRSSRHSTLSLVLLSAGCAPATIGANNGADPAGDDTHSDYPTSQVFTVPPSEILGFPGTQVFQGIRWIVGASSSEQMVALRDRERPPYAVSVVDLEKPGERALLDQVTAAGFTKDTLLIDRRVGTSGDEELWVFAESAGIFGQVSEAHRYGVARSADNESLLLIEVDDLGYAEFVTVDFDGSNREVLLAGFPHDNNPLGCAPTGALIEGDRPVLTFCDPTDPVRRVVTDGGVRVETDVQWYAVISPDQTGYAILRSNGELVFYGALSQEGEAVGAVVDVSVAWNPRFAPDERHLYYVQENGNSSPSLRAYDIGGQASWTVDSTGGRVDSMTPDGHWVTYRDDVSLSRDATVSISRLDGDSSTQGILTDLGHTVGFVTDGTDLSHVVWAERPTGMTPWGTSATYSIRGSDVAGEQSQELAAGVRDGAIVLADNVVFLVENSSPLDDCGDLVRIELPSGARVTLAHNVHSNFVLMPSLPSRLVYSVVNAEDPSDEGIYMVDFDAAGQPH